MAPASATHYDAERHLTWAQFGHCDHQPCGVAVRFEGDARARLSQGPLILVPTGEEEIRLEWLEQGVLERPYGEPGAVLDMTAPFEAKPLGAEPGLYAAAGAALVVGAALVIPSRRFAVASAAAGAGGVAFGAVAASLHSITAFLGGVLLGAIATVGALAVLIAGMRRRPLPAWGIACFVLMVMYTLSAFLLLHYNVWGGNEV